MWIEPLLALVTQGALTALAALFAPRAKPIAFVLGIIAFVVVPWFAGPIVLLRGLSALLGFVLLLRVVDLVRLREAWSASRRLLHVVSFVDTRTLERAPPRIDFLAIGRALLWDTLAAFGFYVAHFPHVLLLRWVGGLVFAYAIIESGYVLGRVLYGAIGFTTPRLHVWPIKSLSIGELWGVRWARPISAWLRDTCFRPLARRGHPMIGLLLGFVISAIGHAYPVLVAIDLWTSFLMFAFFFVQGIFVVLETWLGASRWPRSLRRAWTVTIMLASSPLFVEPALRVLGCC